MTRMSDLSTPKPRRQFFYEGDGILPVYNEKSGECVAIDHREENSWIDAYFDITPDSPERISRRLVALLDYLQDRLGAPYYWTTSNYRSPEYNEEIRKKGGYVAGRSLHIDGMASDGKFAGTPSLRVWKEIQKLNCCGAGYYNGATFHIDTGPVRSWRKSVDPTVYVAPPDNHNGLVIVRTDRDFYSPGDTVTLKLARIGRYPLPLETEFRMLRDGEPIGTFHYDGAGPACLPIESAPERTLRWTLPQDLPEGGPYQVEVRFEADLSPQLKTELLTNPFHVVK